MSPSYVRNLRIQELTKMALSGKKLEEIQKRACEMVSKKIADEYVEEVIRRVS